MQGRVEGYGLQVCIAEVDLLVAEPEGEIHEARLPIYKFLGIMYTKDGGNGQTPANEYSGTLVRSGAVGSFQVGRMVMLSDPVRGTQKRSSFEVMVAFIIIEFTRTT